jgi:toxin-antitoxin system PIN domain toxin
VKFLLDVNVLLAAIWTQHPEHSKTSAWIGQKELVLCPISELGFLRISSNQRAFNYTMADARRGLEQFAVQTNADWLNDDLRALESHPKTSNQVTDHYLADLAARHGLKLATLDGQLKHPAAEMVR